MTPRDAGCWMCEASARLDETCSPRDTEEAGESLRLLYVALTRASSSVVMHWAASAKNTGCSPLHRLLSAREAGSADPKHAYNVDQPPVIASPWVAVESRDRCATSAVAAGPPFRCCRWTSPYTDRSTQPGGALCTRVDRLAARRRRGPGGFREDEPDEIMKRSRYLSMAGHWHRRSPTCPPGPPSEPSSTACWKPWTPTPTTSPRWPPPGTVSGWWHSPSPGEYRCAGWRSYPR